MKRRKGKNWVETDVSGLLGLSPEALVIVEIRAGLALALQKARERQGLGWTECDVLEVDCDEVTATALGIALNRTAELAELCSSS